MIYNSLEPKQNLLVKIIFEIKNKLWLEGLGLFQKEITHKQQIILKALVLVFWDRQCTTQNFKVLLIKISLLKCQSFKPKISPSQLLTASYILYNTYQSLSNFMYRQ